MKKKHATKTNNENKSILGISKVHFIVYVVTLALGIISSVIAILLGFYYNNAAINYFIGLTASLIVTPVFAYFIDIANSKVQIATTRSNRNAVLNPIVMSVLGTFARTVIIHNYSEYKDIPVAFDNIEKPIDILLDKYTNCIGKLCTEKNNVNLINESMNIKQWEVYGLRNLEEQLKLVLDNQIELITNNILSQNEFYRIDILYKATKAARLPYLTMDYDKNRSSVAVDWPKNPLNALEISNMHSSFNYFISCVKAIVTMIPEFNAIKSFHF